MMLTSALLSILIGAAAGILYYGLSFVNAQRNGRFSYSTTHHAQQNIPIALMGMSTLRILIISLIFYLILRLPYINPILLVITFMCVFWSILLVRDLNLWNRLTTS